MRWKLNTDSGYYNFSVQWTAETFFTSKMKFLIVLILLFLGFPSWSWISPVLIGLRSNLALSVEIFIVIKAFFFFFSF